MPISKQPPTSLHYFKARLSILKRPMVWATASGLVLSVFLLGEYLVNPQQYPGSNDLDAATNSPNQNPLGNLPTQNTPASSSELFETLPDISTVPLQTSSDPQSSQSDSSRSPLLQEFLLGRSSITTEKGTAEKGKAGRSQSSLFSTSSENRRDRPSDHLPSLYSLGSPSTGLPSSTLSGDAASRSSAFSSDSSTAINPLQSALDRYSSTASQSPSSSTRSLTQSSAAPGSEDSGLSVTEGSASQDFRRQQESSLQGLPSPQVSPQLSPSPGTTGYTLPPTLQTPALNVRPFPSNSNLQSVPGQITPQTVPAVPSQSYDYGQPSYSAGQTTLYRTVQPALAPYSQPVPSPFSVPRAVPGRSVGGGQINTFSNP